MTRGPSRRQLLQGILGAGAAGSGIGAARDASKRRGRSATGSGVQATIDGWSMFGHDPANTGHDPGESAAIDQPGEWWRYATDGVVTSSPAVVDGVAYVAGSDGTAYAIDADSGQRRWTTSLNVAVGESPAVADGRVFFGGANETVYAMAAPTGTVSWTFDTDDTVRSSPTVADGHVYVGSDDHNVYAIDADSGGLFWSHATGFPVRTTPAYDGRQVYVGSDNRNVQAIDATSGDLMWTTWTNDVVRSSPTVAGRFVYVGSHDGNVYAIQPTTGEELWSFDSGAAVSASPAVADGTVYVGNHDGRVYALAGDTGTPEWSVTADAAVRSSAAVVDGLVVVGTDDGNVYGIDAAAGEVRWRFGTDGAVRSSPAVVDDTVVVGSDDGGLYALADQSRLTTTTTTTTSPPTTTTTTTTTPPPTSPPPTTTDEAGSSGELPVDPLVIGAGGVALLGGGALFLAALARRRDDEDQDGDHEAAGGDGRGGPGPTDDDGGATAVEGGSTPDAGVSTPPPGTSPDPGGAADPDPSADVSSVLDEAETLVADCHPEGPAAAALADARTQFDAGNLDRARERATQATDLARRELDRVETVRSGEGEATVEELRERATVYGLDDELEAVETLVETVAEGRAALDDAETLVADCHPEGPAAAALADARTHFREGNFERARERATQAREIAEMEVDRLETAREAGEAVDEDLLDDLREAATEYELGYVKTAIGDEAGTRAGDPLAGSRPPETVPTVPDLSLSYDAIEKGERLGSGGTADVYRARVRTPDGERLTIALKEPRFEDGYQADVGEEFEHEAETWDNLDHHDNVVGVIDYGSDPHPWIAMEYMDGGTLATVAGEMDIDRAAWTALGTVRGVYHAHEYGVAHLDLKPGNVLLRGTGPETWPVPKIADWGLARLLLEYTGSVRGYTPLYAAPEQIDRDRFGTPGKRTDIYQLGAVCYALFTGRPPHTGEASKVVYDVLETPVTPPTEVDPTLPTRLDEILLKALEKEKDERYETIVYLRDDLQELYDSV